MKQHITPEQLEELSKKGKKRLRKWWWATVKEGAYPGDEFYCEKTKQVEYDSLPSKKCDLPLLSIGQMIEFLGNMGFFDDIHKAIVWDTIEDKWCIEELMSGEIIETLYSNKELCDALWQVVKGVLEK